MRLPHLINYGKYEKIFGMSTDMNAAPVTPFGISVTEDRAATLLGSGIAPSVVAASLGLSSSRISQLISDETFSARVAELRYQNLAKHNARDDKADRLEDGILDQLEESLPMVHRPMELVRAYQIINSAKRRGTSTPEAMIEKQSIVQLVVPIQIINKFQTNVQGQVVTVGEQNLLTIQSGALDNLVKEKRSEIVHQRVEKLVDDATIKEKKNGSPTIETRIIESKEI